MNNKVCCLILVLIIIVLLYNIVVVEKFDTNQPTEINSVVSKMDGLMLNVEKDVDFDTTKNINIKVDQMGNYLGHDYSGLLNFTDENKHPWKLNLLENANDVNTLLDTEGVVDNTGISYPFYMITSGDYALKCINGRISIAKAGNYNSQKWDVSSHRIMKNQLVPKNIYDTPVGPLTPSSVETDKDRIKVNLNINDDKLKQILNIENNQDSLNGMGQGSGTKCDTYLPKSAIESLCPGCDY